MMKCAKCESNSSNRARQTCCCKNKSTNSDRIGKKRKRKRRMERQLHLGVGSLGVEQCGPAGGLRRKKQRRRRGRRVEAVVVKQVQSESKRRRHEEEIALKMGVGVQMALWHITVEGRGLGLNPICCPTERKTPAPYSGCLLSTT